MVTVLIIEDDADLADSIQICVELAGYEAHIATTGESGLVLYQQIQPDAIILDVMLPGIDGIEACKQIRESLPRPTRCVPCIVMLTALGQPTDEVRGLNCGADHYLAKPFEPDVLIAHLQAPLRRDRLQADHTDRADHELLWHHHLKLHTMLRYCLIKRSSAAEWIPLKLPPKGFDVLAKLAQQPGRTFSRTQLYEDIWGLDHDGDERSTVESCIKRLRGTIREALNLPPETEPLIRTVRGVGYKFEDAID